MNTILATHPVHRFQTTEDKNLYVVEVFDRNVSRRISDEAGEGGFYYGNVCCEKRIGLLFGVPGDIFHFSDRPYTRDRAQ